MKIFAPIICGVLILVSCSTQPAPSQIETKEPIPFPLPTSDQVKLPADGILASIPPEAEDLKHTLNSVEYPPRDLIDIANRLRVPEKPIPQVVRLIPWGFELGDKHKFWIEDKNTQEKYLATAKLILKTKHAYLFVEEGIDLDESQLIAISDRFEERIYPNTREFMGEEWSPGVDHDPRLIILFADIDVNYQNSLDEYSKLVYSFSNEMEIIYIGADALASEDDCLIAHEFQHLIQWNVDPNEETWLNEGFSELACRINGLAPWYGDLIVGEFAQNPDTQINAWIGDFDQAIRHYGASYLFVNYFLDRLGEAAVRSLVANQYNGIRSIEEVLNSLEAEVGFDEIFADWVVANYLNDTDIAEGQYGYTGLNPQISKPDLRYQAQQLPVERRTNVKQYAADYILLEGEGSFQIDFSGATLVGLAPITPRSGNYVWWGGRGTNSGTTLTREFDLTGLEKATLTFYTWYEIEEGYDYAYVELSLDGEHWMTLPGQRTTNYNPNGINFGNGYTGGSGGWVQEVIDLTPYVGGKVNIRFEYLTDDGPVSEGIFLDEIRIPELNYIADLEVDEDGWLAHGFIRNSIMLPQGWLLQLITQHNDKTVVKRLQLEPDNTGGWVVDLDPKEKAVIVVSGLTRGTTELANYWYRIHSRSTP